MDQETKKEVEDKKSGFRHAIICLWNASQGLGPGEVNQQSAEDCYKYLVERYNVMSGEEFQRVQA